MAQSRTVSGASLEAGYAEHPDHKLVLEKARGTVAVKAGGRVIAVSDEALVLREANYPPVYYLPKESLKAGDVARTETASWCPFKGRASYFSIAGVADLAWSYEDPFVEVGDIAGRLAFYPDKATIRLKD